MKAVFAHTLRRIDGSTCGDDKDGYGDAIAAR